MAKLGFHVRLRGTPFEGDVQAIFGDVGNVDQFYRIQWDGAATVDPRLYHADELENASRAERCESSFYEPSPYSRQELELDRLAATQQGFKPRQRT